MRKLYAFIRRGVLSGEAAAREVAAYLVGKRDNKIDEEIHTSY